MTGLALSMGTFGVSIVIAVELVAVGVAWIARGMDP